MLKNAFPFAFRSQIHCLYHFYDIEILNSNQYKVLNKMKGKDLNDAEERQSTS